MVLPRSHDINPTLKGVRDGPPVFLVPGKSRDLFAVVSLDSPLFAATIAKTVATGAPSLSGQLGFCPPNLTRLYKESPDSIESTCQRHGGPTHLKRIVTEAGRGVADSLREFLTMIAAEAAKRAIWG
jgi:hypothetical protein